MPEIAEVARAVYYIRKNLVGKTLAVVNAQDDANVFGKVGTSAAEFQKALTGKKVESAGQQGKYFWMIMSSPPHPVFHFGMTGWFHIRGQGSYYYRSKNEDEKEVWPPKFSKFSLQTTGEPKVEAAFTDSRRFSRIRLVNCVAEAIRDTSPLKENGPDPVIDKDILTAEWLEQKLNKKQVPIKALLLDQANISGIGNWVGDEILYNARLHPEQYSNTFSSEEIKRLHTSMMSICQTAVDLLADSSKFPDDWMFKHRWGKGKKDGATALPNGEKITFLTVGGRTSCVVPSVQKKTGAVAGDMKRRSTSSDSEDGKDVPVNKQSSRKRKIAVASAKSKDTDEDIKERKKVKARSRKPIQVKEEILNDNAGDISAKASKLTKGKTSKFIESKAREDIATIQPRRRSSRQAKPVGFL
ncbi:putative formamidopyrimidine-dna protein [Botrytis fragariae]|uniref:Putative formamidopyrimidine-dna protein n=1 Tax=Botrytis fragariae TaxID=1964551 RepID=A0A8H6AML8_9HELO|nr:putative formamidopyrimidine-dna protein [Botrytis fragariae]KAF5870563.1 putative formamidopyrimidine-dna protein [Botrytis fragariae]